LNTPYWFNKIQGEVGSKRSQDSRIIRRVISDEAVYIASLELSGKDDKSVFMKRVFYDL